MSKGSPSVPQPINPQQTAGAQTTSNIQTALANARLGAVNKITPYGDVTYQIGTPPPKQADSGTAAAGGAGAGVGATAAPGLAWENHVRSMMGLPALQPGTPEYNQWLQNQNQRPYGMGGPGAAQGGGGMGGIGGGRSGGAFAGGGGAGDPGAGSHGGQPTM